MDKQKKQQLAFAGAVVGLAVALGASIYWWSAASKRVSTKEEDKEEDVAAKIKEEKRAPTKQPTPTKQPKAESLLLAPAEALPPPQDPVGIKRCMTEFLASKGPAANDPRELERAAQGALRHSGFRALQDVYVRIGLLNDFVAAVNRCYEGSIRGEGEGSRYLKGSALVLTILANMASNESLLPFYVSSRLLLTCTRILKDDLVLHGAARGHSSTISGSRSQDWEGLVEAVMRLLLNVSVNDAGACLLLRERDETRNAAPFEGIQDAEEETGGGRVDALSPVMQMARLSSPASAQQQHHHHQGGDDEDEKEKPLKDPFADPFKRKLWAWKILGNLGGVKEGRSFLKANASELFFGGGGSGKEGEGDESHNVLTAASIRRIGLGEKDSEVRDKAREVARYALGLGLSSA